MNNIDNNIQTSEKDIDIKKIVLELVKWFKYLRSKWIFIAIITFVSLVIGYLSYRNERPIYTAKITYILIDGKSTDLNSSSGIPSFFGLAGGGGMQGTLFSRENLNELFVSNFLLSKVLMKPVDYRGEILTLADLYLKVYKVKKTDSLKNKKFIPNLELKNLNLKERELINSICNNLVKNNILISGKKGTSISLIELKSENEEFSLLFLQNLMNVVSSYYIESQVKKINETCLSLKAQKDSIKKVLDLNLSNVANINDKFINANTSYKQKINLPSQKGQIEVLANQALYIQLIQNLNSQELLLKTQTPLIQIIDETMLPLGVKLPERNVILAYYIFFGMLFSIIFFIIQKLGSDFINENILNDK
jgi:hypothetical protein